MSRWCRNRLVHRFFLLIQKKKRWRKSNTRPKYWNTRYNFKPKWRWERRINIVRISQHDGPDLRGPTIVNEQHYKWLLLTHVFAHDRTASCVFQVDSRWDRRSDFVDQCFSGKTWFLSWDVGKWRWKKDERSVPSPRWEKTRKQKMKK